MTPARRLLLPLALASIATQASIVTLAPIVVEIGRDLGVSDGAVGQGRTALAGAAVLAALAIGPAIDRIGVRPLLIAGALLAAGGAALTAAAGSLAWFLLAHAVAGLGVAALLSAAFAGVAAYFEPGQAATAMGYVVGAQAVAWIVGNPIIGILTDTVSWRLAYAVPAATAACALAGALLLPPAERARDARRAGGVGASRDEGAAAPAGAGGLLAVLREPSARRWAIAELVAYAAWTAELTYAGAFYIRSYGVEEALVGFLLGTGSLVFLLASIRTERVTHRIARRRLVILSTLAMGVVLVPLLNLTPSVPFTLALFCVLALFAGLRSTGSSTLGLVQLPQRAGSMMAARTMSAQLGYMVGAGAGGVVLGLAGFGALGFVLLAGLVVAALLVARVDDPGGGPASDLAETGPAGRAGLEARAAPVSPAAAPAPRGGGS